MTGPVQRIRTFVTLAIRLLAVVMLLIGTYAFIQAVLQLVRYGTLDIEYGDGFTWIGHAAGYLVAGGGLALVSGFLVRWLVPVRRLECPNCGYALKNLKSPACPECGQGLGE